MWGLYARGLIREEGTLRGITQVLRKRWAYLRGGLYAGGYRRKNTVFTIENIP